MFHVLVGERGQSVSPAQTRLVFSGREEVCCTASLCSEAAGAAAGGGLGC